MNLFKFSFHKYDKNIDWLNLHADIVLFHIRFKNLLYVIFKAASKYIDLKMNVIIIMLNLHEDILYLFYIHFMNSTLTPFFLLTMLMLCLYNSMC